MRGIRDWWQRRKAAKADQDLLDHVRLKDAFLGPIDPETGIRPRSAAEITAEEIDTSVLYRPHEWQTIETAPMDGTTVMLWFPEWKHVLGFWKGCWVEADGYASLNGEPTHWMPLPDPPVREEEK